MWRWLIVALLVFSASSQRVPPEIKEFTLDLGGIVVASLFLVIFCELFLRTTWQILTDEQDILTRFYDWLFPEHAKKQRVKALERRNQREFYLRVMSPEERLQRKRIGVSLELAGLTMWIIEAAILLWWASGHNSPFTLNLAFALISGLACILGIRLLVLSERVKTAYKPLYDAESNQQPAAS